MDAAVGAGIPRVDVMLAKLLLDDAAALSLLRARQPRPVDDEALAADQATDVAAFVGERTEHGLHRGSLRRDDKSCAYADSFIDGEQCLEVTARRWRAVFP